MRLAYYFYIHCMVNVKLLCLSFSFKDGQDFRLQMITFTSNISRQEISIDINDDDILEDSEILLFCLSIPTMLDRVIIEETNTTVVIIDDDRESLFSTVNVFIN